MKKFSFAKITAVFLLLCVLVCSGCRGSEAEPFLKSLSDPSEVTTFMQVTEIREGESLVRSETVKVDKGSAVKVETVEKTLAEIGSSEMFDTVSVTEYFTDVLRYYQEGGAWKTEAGEYRASSGITVGESELQSVTVADGVLTAEVPAAAYGKFAAKTDGITAMTIRITLNSENRLASLGVSYKTAKRSVSILTNYGYGEVNVSLPALS